MRPAVQNAQNVASLQGKLPAVTKTIIRKEAIRPFPPISGTTCKPLQSIIKTVVAPSGKLPMQKIVFSQAQSEPSTSGSSGTAVPTTSSATEPSKLTIKEVRRSVPLSISVTNVSRSDSTTSTISRVSLPNVSRSDSITSTVSRVSLPSTSSGIPLKVLQRFAPKPVVEVSVQNLPKNSGANSIAAALDSAQTKQIGSSKKVSFGYFITNIPILGKIRAKRIEEQGTKFIIKVREKGKNEPSFKIFHNIVLVSVFLNQ